MSQRHAESALDEFRRANAEYQSYLSHSGMARAFQLTGQWVEVAREWREVVDGRGEVLRDGFPPDLIAAQLELGQAYERLNQPARAREYYQQVVDAWRRASAEVLARNAQQGLLRLNVGQANDR